VLFCEASQHLTNHARAYGVTVRYNSELPEAKALPENVKKQLEGYESADSVIAKVKALVTELKISLKI